VGGGAPRGGGGGGGDGLVGGGGGYRADPSMVPSRVLRVCDRFSLPLPLPPLGGGGRKMEKSQNKTHKYGVKST